MKQLPKLSLIITFLLLACYACKIQAEFNNSEKRGKIATVKNVYRVYAGHKEGKDVWIVDGLIVRRYIFNEFLYGGNNERYTFVPRNEIWIDNAISAEEYKYTLAHELNERNLMAKQGLSYDDAHDSSLALERRMRLSDREYSIKHEEMLPPVSPTDCDNLKEITSLKDSIQLKNIYRQFIYTKNNISVWIVDGAVVRRDIFPDFGLSGNDLAYHFIPKNEIWIDSQISCEETEFSILSELKEREFIVNGMSYDDAYTHALGFVDKLRKELFNKSTRHLPVRIPKTLTRDLGSGSEK